MNQSLGLGWLRAETALRPMHAGDLATVHRLTQLMSWPYRLEDCAQLFELGAGTIVSDSDGRTVGAGMRWGFGREAGTIGMIVVVPERQGKGIGRALVTAVIAGSEPRALMLNATAEGLELYRKLGFDQIGLVRQHQAPWRGAAVFPPAPTIPVRRASTTDHAALCAIDAAAFGADRSAVISRLLAMGEAWVVERGDRPAGFAILRRFGRGMMIGPIVAPFEDAAIALVSAAGKASSHGVLRVDIPAQADQLSCWLTAAGLPVVDTVTAMMRGAWPDRHEELRRFSLALQALG